MSNFEIEIASIPTRRNLVAEIYYENEQWVEISNENLELKILFYASNKNEFWEFNFQEAVEILLKAKTKLLSIG